MQETVQKSAEGTMLSSFLFSFSLTLLWDLINTLQIYVHFPLFQLEFPGNIQSVLKTFMGIASAEIYTDEDFFIDNFGFDPEIGLEPYTDQFEILGFESAVFIFNMGDLNII